VTSFDLVVPTHIHDDHTCGIPFLQRHQGTRCWALKEVGQVLADPAAWTSTPCTFPKPIRIDRWLSDGEKFRWEEYEFEIHFAPGQTEFHSVYAAMIDGRKVAFTGDNYFVAEVLAGGKTEMLPFQTTVLRNSFQLAMHRRCADVMRAISPELICPGIVRTVDSFGRTGEVPTHPELLDHLALQLFEDGWSFKSLIRRIALSRSFSLSSQSDAGNDARDPDNELMWRAHRRRLDPESLRDAMLSAAGTLDLNPQDSTVSYLGDQATAVGKNPVRRRTDFNCRSVYLPVIRNDLPELFEAFDFANPHVSMGARPKTTVPAQGLFMLNDTLVMTAAEATARRTITELASRPLDAKVDRMFQLIMNRLPTDNERQTVQGYIQRSMSSLNASAESEPELKAVTLACHALFASSRFQFLE
jgi:hypothetical protein